MAFLPEALAQVAAAESCFAGQRDFARVFASAAHDAAPSVVFARRLQPAVKLADALLLVFAEAAGAPGSVLR